MGTYKRFVLEGVSNALMDHLRPIIEKDWNNVDVCEGLEQYPDDLGYIEFEGPCAWSFNIEEYIKKILPTDFKGKLLIQEYLEERDPDNTYEVEI